MADDRGSRILGDLNTGFIRDPAIDEYDFIPILEPEQNRSPVILEQHKLGLEYWSVKILYNYAYSRMMKWRSKTIKSQISGCEEVLGFTRAVVLINADVATAWNIRKEFMCRGILSAKDDLKLAQLVIRKHPKSPETFSHRKWVLKHLLSDESNCSSEDSLSLDSMHIQIGSPAARGILDQELGICILAATRYPNNYNAWTHRIWAMQYLTSLTPKLLIEELTVTENWVRQHISDHSGFHYRQFLIANLSFQTNLMEIVQRELDLITDLITSYPDHEALWYHRRFIISSMSGCQTCESSNKCQKLPPDGVSQDIFHNKRTKLDHDNSSLLQSELRYCLQFEKFKKVNYTWKLVDGYQKWLARNLVTFECNSVNS